MRDIMDLLDDEHIIEAEPARSVRVKRRKIRLSAVAAAAAVCAALTALTAGAVVIYKNITSSPETFYDSQAEKILDSEGLLKHGETVSSEHFSVTLDSVLTDDYLCRVLMTVVPLDDSAKGIVRGAKDGSFFTVQAKDESGKYFKGNTDFRTLCADDESIAVSFNIYLDHKTKELLKDTGCRIELSGSYLKNAGFTVHPEKNLETRTAKTANGMTLYLSPIELVRVTDSYDPGNKDLRGFNFIWKEGGRERFLERLGITEKQDEINRAKSKWVDWEYVCVGKFINSGVNGGLGGGGIGLFTDYTPDGTLNDELGHTCAMTMDFGGLVDMNDIIGIEYGLETLMFEE